MLKKNKSEGKISDISNAKTLRHRVFSRFFEHGRCGKYEKENGNSFEHEKHGINEKINVSINVPINVIINVL